MRIFVSLKHCKTNRIMRRLFRPGPGFGAGIKLNFEVPHVAERSDYAVAFLLPIDQ